MNPSDRLYKHSLEEGGLGCNFEASFEFFQKHSHSYREHICAQPCPVEAGWAKRMWPSYETQGSWERRLSWVVVPHTCRRGSAQLKMLRPWRLESCGEVLEKADPWGCLATSWEREFIPHRPCQRGAQTHPKEDAFTWVPCGLFILPCWETQWRKQPMAVEGNRSVDFWLFLRENSQVDMLF